MPTSSSASVPPVPLYAVADPYCPGGVGDGALFVAWSESDVMFDSTLVRGVDTPRAAAELVLWWVAIASEMSDGWDRLRAWAAEPPPSPEEVAAARRTPVHVDGEDEDEDDEIPFDEAALRRLYVLLSDWLQQLRGRPRPKATKVLSGLGSVLEPFGIVWDDDAGGFTCYGWTLALAKVPELLEGSGTLALRLREEVFGALEEDSDDDDSDDDDSDDDDSDEESADIRALWTDASDPVPEACRDAFFDALNDYAERIGGG